jgi:hypothetical protein
MTPWKDTASLDRTKRTWQVVWAEHHRYRRVPWQYVHPHYAYATIRPARIVLATIPLMQQFTTATLCHLYDTSRDLMSTRAKSRCSVSCVTTSTADQWHVHLPPYGTSSLRNVHLTERPPYGTSTLRNVHLTERPPYGTSTPPYGTSTLRNVHRTGRPPLLEEKSDQSHLTEVYRPMY